jgi:YVTN family beta-propeller protein
MNAGATAGCPAVGSVSAVDTAALAVVSTTCVGQADFGMPSAIAQLPNGGKLYVLAGAVIYVLDPSGSTVLTTIENLDIVSPWSPNAITSNLDGTLVFVLDKTRTLGRPHSGGIWIITTSSDTLSSSPIGGGYPDFSVLDTHLNRLYVADSTSNTVSVFDASKVTTLATVNVGSSPVGVAALPDGTKFYVANGVSNDVTVVDASSFQVLATVTVGQRPAFIQSEPTSSKIYVADQGSSDVAIIETSDDTISATINSPPQDPTCTRSCALQTPVMIVAH